RLICGRLGIDPAAGGAWIFYPGRHNPANTSTNIIDCGECVDALATLLRYGGEALAAYDRARLAETITSCCNTYLVANVQDKPIINQRLWGAMGLAAAYAALGVPAWAAAVTASIARSLAEMRADGSFPYVTDPTSLGEHPGIADVTVHYHSRCVGFARYAATCLGQADAFSEPLRRGADFLCAVLRPDGLKPLGLEGKRWFWDDDAEAGSAAYDAYVLAADGRPELRALATQVAARSLAAVGQDGWVQATARPSFVCRVFHTADLTWLVRAYAAAAWLDGPSPQPSPLQAEGADAPSPPPSPLQGEAASRQRQVDVEKGEGQPSLHHLAGARVWQPSGLIRLDAPEACAIARASKRAANLLVGGRIGGGGLVYVGRRDGRWSNLLKFVPEPDVPEAAWVHDPGFGGESLFRLLPRRDPATRFRLHIARSHWKAGRRAYALAMLWRFLGRPAYLAQRRYESSHAMRAEVVAEGPGITVRSGLARLDGTPLPYVTTVRAYRLADGRLHVHDRLTTERLLPVLAYRYPEAADGFEVTADAPWRTRGGLLIVGPLVPGAAATITYRL
ncbi:MAG: hypothetical protein FJ029_06355, partial [Actinobacteria bacterium]|nr:hypothetical protein [Actinomycetota bacterium]